MAPDGFKKDGHGQHDVDGEPTTNEHMFSNGPMSPEIPEFSTEIDATWIGKEPFRIPEEFEMMGRTYKVVKDASLVGTGLGQISYNDALIRLYPTNGEHKIPKEVVEVSFCHELVHLLFTDAGKPDLSNDENLVEMLAKLLHQFLVTKRGDIGIDRSKVLADKDKL